MMKRLNKKYFFAASFAVLLLLSPVVFALRQGEPRTRIITVQTYKVPRAEWNSFFRYVDDYMMPRIKANPHIISFRLANHYYGTHDPNVWLFIEYASLAAVEQGDQWSDQYVEENYPEGSAKRDSLDAVYHKFFLPYWQNHTDNILIADENRMK